MKIKAKEITKFCLDKQTILSDNEVNRISNRLIHITSNRYFKVLLIAAPIAFIANSIINDPVRPYSSEIAAKCKELSSEEKTGFNAKDTYKRCKKGVYKVIRKTHKIALKEGLRITHNLSGF